MAKKGQSSKAQSLARLMKENEALKKEDERLREVINKTAGEMKNSSSINIVLRSDIEALKEKLIIQEFGAATKVGSFIEITYKLSSAVEQLIKKH